MSSFQYLFLYLRARFNFIASFFYNTHLNPVARLLAVTHHAKKVKIWQITCEKMRNLFNYTVANRLKPMCRSLWSANSGKSNVEDELVQFESQMYLERKGEERARQCSTIYMFVAYSRVHCYRSHSCRFLFCIRIYPKFWSNLNFQWIRSNKKIRSALQVGLHLLQGGKWGSR